MIRQFIIEPIVDVMLMTRTPFNELTNYLWRTQMTLTNLLEHDAVVKNPRSPILIVESMSITMSFV